MNWNLQRTLAKEAGVNERTGETWAELYDYHLGMVEKPLPFYRFKMKQQLLDRLLAQDPEGKKASLDQPINRLCNELGY